MEPAWTENGPIALPPRALAYGVGVAFIVLMFVGVWMGLNAAQREGGPSGLGGSGAQSADSADTLIAKPIVELTPPPVANEAVNQVAADDKDDAKVEALQEKTAEAQAVQSTPSKSGGDIDQILASPTEKPTAPAKSAGGETPPGPPVKSDVPF